MQIIYGYFCYTIPILNTDHFGECHGRLSSTCALYSRGVFFCTFLSPSWELLELYLKLGHGYFVAYLFQIHYLLIILSFNAMNSELLRALLKTEHISANIYGIQNVPFRKKKNSLEIKSYQGITNVIR
jgi:hypothetical protein